MFKVGDMVRIVDEIPKDAYTRDYYWIAEMNEYRGKEMIIKRITKDSDGASGYYYLENGYYYHKNWVEPFNPIPIVPIIGIDDLGLL